MIVPFLKFENEQFLSSPVFCFFICPGFFVSASITLKFSSPKISFSTWSECRVPDIMTRTLFCSISSWSFCAKLIETSVAMIGSSLDFDF